MRSFLLFLLILTAAITAQAQDFQQTDIDFLEALHARFHQVKPFCSEVYTGTPGTRARPVKHLCNWSDSVYERRQETDLGRSADSASVYEAYWRKADANSWLQVAWTRRLVKDSIPYEGELFYFEKERLMEKFEWNRQEPGLRSLYFYGAEGRIIRTNYYRKGGVVNKS